MAINNENIVVLCFLVVVCASSANIEAPAPAPSPTMNRLPSIRYLDPAAYAAKYMKLPNMVHVTALELNEKILSQLI